MCFVDVYTICNRKYILGARSIVRPHSDDKCESDTCAKQKKEQVEIRPPPHRAVCVCLCVCVLCASRTSTLHLSLKRYVQKMLRKFTTVTRKSDNDVVHLRVQHEFGSLPPINHYIHFEEEVSPSHRFLLRRLTSKVQQNGTTTTFRFCLRPWEGERTIETIDTTAQPLLVPT